MIVNEKMISEAYTDLMTATKRYQDAALSAAGARKDYKATYSDALSKKTIAGKNSYERDAAFFELHSDLVDVLHETETLETVWRNAMDLARINVEYVRALLRFDELTAHPK